jgi:hypothetical protein
LFCCYPYLNEVDRLSYLQYLLNLERWKKIDTWTLKVIDIKLTQHKFQNSSTYCWLK